MTVRLTKRRLKAMDNALSSMLAGAEGEGYWDPDNSWDDMQAAQEWVWQKLDKYEEYQ